ncbi:putative receptor-like protein kinase At2g23200 isoform X3 [Tasmannia lanceolata]|uniref:putative receptor-like protein kinase At2g23200 isoform X3 n=1 Tax=Tasmannia lanceolata TaxID=3420 RepID=UPI004062C206
MSSSLAAIIGGAAGAITLLGIIVLSIWFCLFRNRSISRNSENGSSDPSLQAGRNVGTELSLRGGVPSPNPLEARYFMLEDISLATKNFSDINLIGVGKFGEVYKALLNDGVIVAIKKRFAAPSQEFIKEVKISYQVFYLSSIRHRHVVSLLGYCQENGQQMLVSEYIPNGSVSSHIYGASQLSGEKLEFKNRLSIALGAATGPSFQMVDDDIFLDPEVRDFGGRFSEKSDVYSFGVFLLELVSGREASRSQISESDQSVVEWVQNYRDTSDISVIVDRRLGTSFTTEGMKEFIQLTAQCVNPSSERRPAMNYVVSELDRIREKEMSLTTVMGEGTPTVTLGSHLFTALR